MGYYKIRRIARLESSSTIKVYGWLVLKYIGASFPNFIMTIALFNGS
jgi:hypothetical protein